MSLCLLTLFQNERSFLEKHLDIVLQSPAIDGVVAVDGGSADDSASVVAQMCLKHDKFMTVFQRGFDWDFSKQANFGVACAERMGYTYCLRLDPDECMFPLDIEKVRACLESEDFKGLPLAFPRYNFEGDAQHYMPQYYPDHQVRAWPLNLGFYYTNPVHEQLSGFPLNMNSFHIYHYEGLRNDLVRRLKHINYARLAQGLEPLKELPEGDSGVTELRERKNFEGRQPIDQ